ncbi:MAG: DUF6231 family protein [Acidihalobacter sp.]|jgi:hypothetical protein
MYSDDQPLCRALATDVGQGAHDRLLLLASPAHAALGACLDTALEITECRQVAPEDGLTAASDTQRWDCAVLAGALEQLPRSEGEHLISSLRDIYARRLYILVDAATDRWPARDLIAFGLSEVGRSETQVLYRYDVSTYKRTPDWLNPRFWAHPELWDKFRW